MKLSNLIVKKIQDYMSAMPYAEYWHSGNSSTSLSNKLRVQKIKEFKIEAEPLKINKKYALNLVYDYEAIVEKPPKYERKCRSGFLVIGKNYKNVEVAQSFSENEMKEVIKEIRDKIIVNAFVDLPKEDYELYKQILCFKFPQNKILK